MLAVILSKAFLLANDKAIKDQLILRADPSAVTPMRTGDASEPLLPPPAPFRQTSPNTLELRGGFASALMLGRPSLTLDLSTNSLVRRRGLLVPMQEEERRLNEFTAVVIAFRRGDSDSPDRFPVRLRALRGKDLNLTTPAKYAEARKQAAYLSRFLRLPLADATSDHETVVSPEMAGASLRDRHLSGGLEDRPSVPPPAMQCEVTESAGELRIVMRGPKIPLAGIVGALFPAVVLLILIPTFVRIFMRNQSTWGVQLVFFVHVLIFGIPSIAAGVYLMVGSRRNGTTVKASPAGLVIERRRAWRTQSQTITASDILELDYRSIEGVLHSAKSQAVSSSPREGVLAVLKKWVPTEGIVVKSRQELTTFGGGLPVVELQYLCWLLTKALAGR